MWQCKQFCSEEFFLDAFSCLISIFADLDGRKYKGEFIDDAMGVWEFIIPPFFRSLLVELSWSLDFLSPCL